MQCIPFVSPTNTDEHCAVGFMNRTITMPSMAEEHSIEPRHALRIKLDPPNQNQGHL